MKDKTKSTAPKVPNTADLQEQLKDFQNDVSEELSKLNGDDRPEKVSKIVQGSGRKGG